MDEKALSELHESYKALAVEARQETGEALEEAGAARAEAEEAIDEAQETKEGLEEHTRTGRRARRAA